MCRTEGEFEKAARLLELFGWVMLDPTGYLCGGDECWRWMSVKLIVCYRAGRGLFLLLSGACQKNEGGLK